MLVVQINMRHAEPLQAGVAALADIFRPAVHAQKLALCVPDVAKLGRQDHPVAAALDGPADEPFILPAAIHVGGVQKIDSQVQRPVDGGDGFLIVARAVEFGHPHATQAEGRHGQPLGSEFFGFHKPGSGTGRGRLFNSPPPPSAQSNLNFGFPRPLTPITARPPAAESVRTAARAARTAAHWCSWPARLRPRPPGPRPPRPAHPAEW